MKIWTFTGGALTGFKPKSNFFFNNLVGEPQTHDFSGNPKKWEKIADGKSPVEQENFMIDVINNSNPFSKRVNKIYVNFSNFSIITVKETSKFFSLNSKNFAEFQ